jgi:hypothetical protein
LSSRSIRAYFFEIVNSRQTGWRRFPNQVSGDVIAERENRRGDHVFLYRCRVRRLDRSDFRLFFSEIASDKGTYRGTIIARYLLRPRSPLCSPQFHCS